MTEKMLFHLKNEMIPFWMRLEDIEHGGCYGFMDEFGNIDKTADKSVLLLCRNLWFFSSAARVLHDTQVVQIADRYYSYLQTHFLDRENGGVYYILTYDNKVKSNIKNVYFQSFAIYALSEYAMLTHSEQARQAAMELFDYIESMFRTKNGYREQLDGENVLADKGCVCPRTMNAVLHIIEAYTNLVKATKDERVASALRNLLRLVADKIYNPQEKRLDVFFDENYKSLCDYQSYGHDIESAWLLREAATVVQDKVIKRKIGAISDALTESVYQRAFIEQSVVNECVNGIVDTDRIWWVQAESVTGFYKAYKATGQEKYRLASERIFHNIEQSFIGKHGEWHWLITAEGKTDESLPLAGAWKCPYHNGRMYLEIIKEQRDEKRRDIAKLQPLDNPPKRTVAGL